MKKVKDEKLALSDELQENSEVHEKTEKLLKLEIENGKKEMEEMVTRHNNIFIKFKENLECPVCLEIPRSGPVFVCQNGHFVCKKCKAGSCPTCRVEMGNGKSLLAVTVIENIDHKCKFVECEELFNLEKLDAHEKICQHRIVKCPHFQCGVEMALSKLLDHLGMKTCCANSIPIAIEKIQTAKYNFDKLTLLEGNQDASWKVHTFSYRKINFAICGCKSGDYYHFTMVMFESEEVCSKFTIDMEVHERDSSYHESDLSIRFRGNPCSIDEDKSQVKFRGLTMHQEAMKKMFKRNQHLPFHFAVSFSFSEKRATKLEGLDKPDLAD